MKSKKFTLGFVKNSLLVVLFIALLGLLILWGVDDDSSQSQTPQKSESQVTTADAIEQVCDNCESETPPSTESSAVQSDNVSLPSQVTDETASVGEHINGRQRVVIPDDVVDTFIEDESKVAEPQSSGN